MPIQTERICEKHPELNGLRYNSGHCAQCMKDTNRKWDKKNADKVRETTMVRMQRFRGNMTEEQKLAASARQHEWYLKNQEREQARGREHQRKKYELDPSEFIWQARVRRDRVAHQTPRWASKKAISAIYRRARDLGMTVDHVVPLKGENVSGLHVENNLQILPRSENSSKGNHFTF